MDADEDAELMLRAGRGDEAAFSKLFDRHQRSVVRFAHRFVGDPARAEELAQEIFVKLYRNARRYRPSARFKTFLFRVAANHCLNEVRRGEYRVEQVSKDAQDEATQPLPDATTPDQQVAGRELEGAVRKALEGLSERERMAFSLCRFEGMAYRDIASALSASEAAVKSLIHRATLAVAKSIEALESGGMPARSRT